MSRYGLLIAGSVMLVLGGATKASAQGPSCDRACLRTMLDQYLTAVIKHDPAAAPLVVGFRQTENAINVRPGNGMWKTMTALGKVQRRYLDPVSGQAAYYGTIEEGSSTAVVTIRVRVENKQLTEAEWYVARADDPGLNGPRQPGRPPANLHNPEYLAQNPPPERVVASDKRSDRAALVRIVNSYFDAITSHDGSVALTHPGCGRVENGTPVPAGRFLPPIAPANPPAGSGGPPATNDCVSGLEKFNGQMVVARRIPLADEEAQVVLAYAVFIRRPGSPTPRNVFSEWFVIDEAKIRTVYAAMFYPPPELAVPNWPPYDGNWPLPATIVPAPKE
ncbi:MAG TPA: hypothetical protein VFS23_16755 [Vicinamibacterales bacterium]|nr:hypothetical protein [Vicinamibacterales bacterium]